MKFNSSIYNRTALHIAVEKESAEIVKLLLKQKKINPNITDLISIYFIYSQCFDHYLIYHFPFLRFIKETG